MISPVLIKKYPLILPIVYYNCLWKRLSVCAAVNHAQVLQRTAAARRRRTDTPRIWRLSDKNWGRWVAEINWLITELCLLMDNWW